MIITLKQNLPEGKWWSRFAGQDMECDIQDKTMGYRVKESMQDDVEFYIPEAAVQTIRPDGTKALKVGLELLNTACTPESHGNWIDLKTSREVILSKGEFTYISLGVKIALPEGYEAYIVSRSSTFKKYGVVQTNAIGIIDNEYGEEWMMPAYATRDVMIAAGTRICQFRLHKIQDSIVLYDTTMKAEGKTRSGLGSTDKKSNNLKKLK